MKIRAAIIRPGLALIAGIALVAGTAGAASAAPPGSGAQTITALAPSAGVSGPRGVSVTQRQAVQIEAVRALQRIGKSPSFAGIRVSDDGTAVEIYTTAATRKFVRKAIGPDAATDFRFRTNKYNRRDLTDAMDRIVRDEPWLRSHGVRLISVFPAPEIDSVLVKALHLTAAGRQLLASSYGDIVSPVAGGAPVKSFASRLNDTAQWNGGDVIGMDNGADCTSGPGVITSSGKTFVLTAGHCYLNGTTTGRTSYIYRTFQGSHLVTGDNNTYMGLASAEHTWNGYDDALIDARSYGHDWRTAQLTDVGTAVKQVAAESSVGGMKVCVSGAFSGENCNATVIHAGGTAWVEGVPLIHMTEVVNRGVVLAGPGDSGAPVYEVHASGLFVTGMLISGAPDLPCQYYNIDGRTNRCSDDVLYQEMVSIDNHLGVKLYAP